MELDRFIEEAKALARPGVLLREIGVGEPVALWHGLDAEGRVISVLHKGAWLTLKADGRVGPSVIASERAELTGKPLFGEPYLSLPPVDAVFLLGSEAVGDYLSAHDWPRNEPFNSNFKHPIPGEYERIWNLNCPMYVSDVVAVSGGWHFPWPDGDWDELVSSQLVVWTLRDAEPWFEMFDEEGRYSAYERVT